MSQLLTTLTLTLSHGKIRVFTHPNHVTNARAIQAGNAHMYYGLHRRPRDIIILVREKKAAVHRRGSFTRASDGFHLCRGKLSRNAILENA